MNPPDGSTTLCLDELGPVVPRTFPPATGWSPTGHRIKAPLDYGRGAEKVWVYGALRVRDGQELTMAATSRAPLSPTPIPCPRSIAPATQSRSASTSPASSS